MKARLIPRPTVICVVNESVIQAIANRDKQSVPYMNWMMRNDFSRKADSWMFEASRDRSQLLFIVEQLKEELERTKVEMDELREKLSEVKKLDSYLF